MVTYCGKINVDVKIFATRKTETQTETEKLKLK